jgi:predicted ArsR family transcriptional regulator
VVGRELISHADDDPANVIAAIEREAMRLGFAPERHERGERVDLVLQHCPYADIAAADLGAVCELHRGLVEGMANCNDRVVVEGLRVADPHRGGCRVQLRRLSG